MIDDSVLCVGGEYGLWSGVLGCWGAGVWSVGSYYATDFSLQQQDGARSRTGREAESGSAAPSKLDVIGTVCNHRETTEMREE